MEGFEINRIKLLLLTFLILTLSSIIGAAAEVHPGDSIQAAVNSANSGDTIIVYPGTYYESINIYKIGLKNLVLMSASGNTTDTIIASNSTDKNVISVTYGENITIKGFTISGAVANDTAGINMVGSPHCTIENNVFLNDALGVQLKAASNYNTVRNNIFAKDTIAGAGRGVNIEGSNYTIVSGNLVSKQRYGIYTTSSEGNNISGNTVSQCEDHGIVIQTSKDNTLKNNAVRSNGNLGIYLRYSSNNELENNTVSSGTNGIKLEWSQGDNLSGNRVDLPSEHAIFLDNSSNSNLQSNTVSGSSYGIALRYSDNNNLVNNNAYNNTRGFYLTLTSGENKLSANKANSNTNGIVLAYNANNNIIDNNEANLNNNYGIALGSSFENNVSNNKVSQNDDGISLDASSTSNILSGNTVNSNKGYGILLENASDNNVIGNIVGSNKNGIYLVNSSNSYVSSNTVQSNEGGINLVTSNLSEIFNNSVSDNHEYGIFVSLCNNNTISANTAFNSSRGISLNSSESNNVSGNIVTWNINYGIFLCARSYNNLIYNNNFNNAVNTNVRNARCVWNIAETEGRNIMGGSYLGGNFWAKPDGSGHSQITPDANNDGFADSPFTTDNVTDNLPLIDVPDPVVPTADFSTSVTSGYAPLTVQFTDLSENAVSRSWDIDDDGIVDSTNKSFVHVYQNSGNYTARLTVSNDNGTDSKTQDIVVTKFTILPVADFSANVTSGYAPLSVLFTDKSQNATSWSWDIGSDGTVESTNASFVYVFTNPGTYPVSLTAINENGTSPAKTATITVTEESSSSGGGSHHSSGGGGGGGSPEPQTNVQVKELSQARVTNGKPVMFDFTNNATCVVYVGFDAKKTAGKITTIAEQLKTKSTLVSVLDSGEVYKYFNLWVGNSGFANSNNIENPVVCFKVEKSWLQDKKINQSSITLNRYNDKKWSQMPVKLLKEDSKYLYFTAETPGFSFFAITGKAVEKVAEAKPSINTSKLEKNSTASETEPEQKNEQETRKDKTSSIPGFEALYVVACLVVVFLHRRK